MAPKRPILVVDDDAGVREFLSVALREEGYRVAAAADGQAALRAVEREPPALILLDLWMPRLDGAGFLAAYRCLPNGRAPIVVCAAVNDPRSLPSELAIAAYLPKPVDLDELLATVARLTAPQT